MLQVARIEKKPAKTSILEFTSQNSNKLGLRDEDGRPASTAMNDDTFEVSYLWLKVHETS
jgi:hypothetical protein